LVFVLNAASRNPAVALVLPKHVFRHALYLRTSMPDLFPDPLPPFVVRINLPRRAMRGCT